LRFSPGAAQVALCHFFQERVPTESRTAEKFSPFSGRPFAGSAEGTPKIFASAQVGVFAPLASSFQNVLRAGLSSLIHPRGRQGPVWAPTFFQPGRGLRRRACASLRRVIYARRGQMQPRGIFHGAHNSANNAAAAPNFIYYR
jgi:hypothetical protein